MKQEEIEKKINAKMPDASVGRKEHSFVFR